MSTSIALVLLLLARLCECECYSLALKGRAGKPSLLYRLHTGQSAQP